MALVIVRVSYWHTCTGSIPGLCSQNMVHRQLS
jgi:hypothetical protein